MEENSMNFINSRRENYNPAIWSNIILPALKPSSPDEKQDHPTIQCLFSKTNYQHFFTNYQIPASRSLRWGIPLYMSATVWVISGFLISVIPLVVLGSTWRFLGSLTHPWVNSERQVSYEKFLEDSMSIHLEKCLEHLSNLAHHAPQKASSVCITLG